MKGRSLFGLMVGFAIFGAGSESVLAQTNITVPARNNNTGADKVSINRISDPNQQNTAGRSPSASQQTQTGRSPQVAQNINQFTRFEIGKLSTGQRVLRVSPEQMLQSPFKEAMRQPLRPISDEKKRYISREDYGIFLWDGRKLIFTGLGVATLADFKIGNQTYWVTLITSVFGDGPLEISKPNLVNSKRVILSGAEPYRGSSSPTTPVNSLSELKIDSSKNGFFYGTVRYGNGWNYPVITYLLDLRIAAANPNQNVVVCESSRYTHLRNGVSPTKENPDCRTGQQVMARRAPSPNQQTNTGRSPASNQQTTTGRSPASNPQTATRTVQPVRQTFSSVKSLGMAQFLWESTELKSAQETLQKAARGEYNTITNGQKIDFFEEGITEIRPVDCKSFGFSCESKEITYADYLNLKLKVYLQIGIFKNGMKVYDQISKYQNRLFQERRYGGLNVGQNLTSEWEKRWNNVKEQQRLKDKQANLPITERLGVVMEQTIKDTANFSVELFKTSTKVAATLAQIKDLADTITSLTSINQYNLNRIAGGPKYTIAAVKILTDAGKALQSFDTDKLNELTLKAAQETIELINAQDRKVAGSANVIKIYFSAKDIIDKNKLLRQPQATNALDEFDRFYIAAAMYSKAVDVIIGGLSIPFSEAKVVDTLLKKADAVNTVLFEALEFTYKDTVRRQYVRLQYAYNRNQIQVVGLSSFIDYAAEEVGKYLLKARPDLVTRRPDGTIAVSVDGVVYPP
jgi:hypothetical protein